MKNNNPLVEDEKELNSIISFGASKEFSKALNKAKTELGFESRSELIRLAIRIFLRDQGVQFERKNLVS